MSADPPLLIKHDASIPSAFVASALDRELASSVRSRNRGQTGQRKCRAIKKDRMYVR